MEDRNQRAMRFVREERVEPPLSLPLVADITAAKREAPLGRSGG
jgi:hypothetical protein